MKIYKSSEFPGLGFQRDGIASEFEYMFFKALVKENLRKLAALDIGKRLLKAIRDARPAFVVKDFPKGVNVVMSRPDRQFSAPGINPLTKQVYDKYAYGRWHDKKETWLHRTGEHKLIPSAKSKASASEMDRSSARNGTGTVCLLYYTNTEMLSSSGEWFIPHISMGHELIHCLHALRGEMRDDPDEEWFTVGIKGYEGRDFTENKLRAAADFPLRTKYYSDD